MSSSNFLRLFFVSVFLLISSVHSQDYTWNLGPLKNKLTPNSEIVSPVFFLKAFPTFSAKARLVVKSDNAVYITLACHSLWKDRRDPEKMTVVPAVSYTLKDPNNRDAPRKNKCNAIPNSTLLFDKFYYEMKLRPLNLLTSNISITISVAKQPAGKVCISDAK